MVNTGDHTPSGVPRVMSFLHRTGFVGGSDCPHTRLISKHSSTLESGTQSTRASAAHVRKRGTHAHTTYSNHQSSHDQLAVADRENTFGGWL